MIIVPEVHIKFTSDVYSFTVIQEVLNDRTDCIMRACPDSMDCKYPDPWKPGHYDRIDFHHPLCRIADTEYCRKQERRTGRKKKIPAVKICLFFTSLTQTPGRILLSSERRHQIFPPRQTDYHF